jgi:DNA-directed RNA polymerase subunit N (RpoN/RPB10)
MLGDMGPVMEFCMVVSGQQAPRIWGEQESEVCRFHPTTVPKPQTRTTSPRPALTKTSANPLARGKPRIACPMIPSSLPRAQSAQESCSSPRCSQGQDVATAHAVPPLPSPACPRVLSRRNVQQPAFQQVVAQVYADLGVFQMCCGRQNLTHQSGAARCRCCTRC